MHYNILQKWASQWENQPVDFNNDGWVDVFGLGGLIMFNNGDMTFTASTSPAYSGATGDLNHDGAVDIMSGSTIYFNDVDTNNYLTISTVGVQSNKQGIGAVVLCPAAAVFEPKLAGIAVAQVDCACKAAVETNSDKKRSN